MNDVHVNYDPSCIRRDATDLMHDQNAEPMVVDGTLFMPASCLRIGASKVGDAGAEFVAIMVSLGEVGLFHHVTAECARELAQQINLAAAQIEARVAAQADAAIDAARKAGQ